MLLESSLEQQEMILSTYCDIDDSIKETYGRERFLIIPGKLKLQIKILIESNTHHAQQLNIYPRKNEDRQKS